MHLRIHLGTYIHWRLLQDRHNSTETEARLLVRGNPKVSATLSLPF